MPWNKCGCCLVMFVDGVGRLCHRLQFCISESGKRKEPCTVYFVFFNNSFVKILCTRVWMNGLAHTCICSVEEGSEPKDCKHFEKNLHEYFKGIIWACVDKRAMVVVACFDHVNPIAKLCALIILPLELEKWFNHKGACRQAWISGFNTETHRVEGDNQFPQVVL